jgi:hypothetical protein
MTFEEYQLCFHKITSGIINTPPYHNPDYLNYTKLNWSRMNRWLKMGKLSENVIKSTSQIKERQSWIIITEPWCGDAAHIVPFIEMVATLNPKLSTRYELRDSAPHRIEQYLTNGKSKSIPKLIIKNELDKDLAVWGPRPFACQKMYDALYQKNTDFDTIKTELQHWYNQDNGKEILKEINQIIEQINGHQTTSEG